MNFKPHNRHSHRHTHFTDCDHDSIHHRKCTDGTHLSKYFFSKYFSDGIVIILALSIATSPASAASSTNRTIAATAITAAPITPIAATQNTAIQLLLESLKSTDKQKSMTMVARARELLQKEQLPPETLKRIEYWLEQAQQRITENQNRPTPPDSSDQRKNDRGGSKNNKDRTGQTQTPFAGRDPIAFDDGRLDEQQKLLAQNPEMLASFWEIGRGRVERDADNIDNLIRDRTGRTPQDYDNSEWERFNNTYQPGTLISTLVSYGLIPPDFSAVNRTLRQEFPGASLDTLADHIIERNLLKAGAVGAIKPALKNIPDDLKFLGLRLSAVGSIGGISAEVVSTLAINASLVLQLADLYNLRLNTYEQEITVLAVLAVARLSINVGLRNTSLIRELIQITGIKLVDDRITRSNTSTKMNGPNFLQRLFKHPTFRKLVTRVTPSPQIAASTPVPTTATEAAPSANAPSSVTTNPTSGGAIPGGAGTASAETPAHETTNSRGATQTHESSTPPSNPPSKKRITFKGIVIDGLDFIFNIGWSAGESYVVGQVAKEFFAAAMRRDRAIHNNLFREFLMSPSGEGFFKLLIISMNIGKPTVDPIDLGHPAEPKVKFILNLARSARICSPTDMNRLAQIKSTSTTNSPTGEQKLLEAACDTNLNQGRHQRLKGEFQTFNEIPTDFVSNLRIASRENRLRMGEALLQMQYLDGDRTPDEVKYFTETVTKILGFTEIADLDYFEQLHTFITKNGGMTDSDVSPTGYGVANKSTPNPYDMIIGYTDTHGPDAPRTPLPPEPDSSQSPASNPPVGQRRSSPW